MNDSAAQAITQALPNLTHPGDGKSGVVAIPMQQFRTTGMQDQDMAETIGAYAKLAGEAIVLVIEGTGQTIIPTVELEQLRRAAAANEHQRHREVQVHCHCGTPLFKADIVDFDTANARISPNVIPAMAQLNPNCHEKHGVR